MDLKSNQPIPSPLDLQRKLTQETLDNACTDIVKTLTENGEATWNATNYSGEFRALLSKHFTDAGWLVKDEIDELNSFIKITKPAV